jgi:heterodisulfide reductase subunit A-like polyferredoxin
MPRIETGEALTVCGKAIDGTDVRAECDSVVLSVAHSHGGDHEELARSSGVGLDDLGFFRSGDSLSDPFASPVGGIFVCGFARAPVIAEEAFIEGLGAAGAICRYLKP